VAVKKEKLSGISLLQSVFNHCITNSLPFAAYRIPGEDIIHIIHQQDTAIAPIASLEEMIGEEGFLFHPFIAGEKEPAYLIKADVHASITVAELAHISNLKIADLSGLHKRKVKALGKDDFEKYIAHAKRKIKKGKFEKVVAARCIKKARPDNFNPISIFSKACLQYTSSFVSCVFTKQSGIWLGASPEILLRFENGIFTTYSLAGTKPLDKKTNAEAWGEKEQHEQQVVSNYIESEISSFAGIKLETKGPESVAAGNIMHLRTTFNIRNLPHYSWGELAAKLHPTPAVCGMPKQSAMEFITGQEKDTRAYYSGYLGPVNIEDQINLYVNLRCMEVQQKKLVLHVGCGITAASNADAEWEETKLKSQTMLQLLEN
jgi:isochorismate synthase